MEVVSFGLDDVEARLNYDMLFSDCAHAFIQQSTYWAEVIGNIGPDEAIFLMAMQDGKAVGALPLYLFRGSHGCILNSVPQAGPLGGVFHRKDLDDIAIYNSLISKANQLAVEKDCLTLTFITNPFDHDLEHYARQFADSIILENFTQVLSIPNAVRHGEFILPNAVDPNIRRHIRKSSSLGYSARVARHHSDFDSWYAVHVARHSEIGAKPIDRLLLQNIVEFLGPTGRSLFTVVERDGRIVGGCIIVRHRNIADMFIMSIDSAAAKDGVTYLLIKEALVDLEARETKVLNWQSSPRRGDGVYTFKKQWGSEERPYYFITRIYCEEERILSLGADGVRQGYPGHYVVPFGVFESGFALRRFRKP